MIAHLMGAHRAGTIPILSPRFRRGVGAIRLLLFLALGVAPLFAAPPLRVEVQCARFEEKQEEVAAFEARLRLELALARRGGSIEVTCPGELLLTFVPPQGASNSAVVPWLPEENLGDRLIVAATRLSASPPTEQIAEESGPKEESAEAPTDVAPHGTKEAIIWGLRGGGSLDFWSSGWIPAGGGHLAVVGRREDWLASAGGSFRRQLGGAEGFTLDAIGVRLAAERALLEAPWVLDVGLSSRFDLFRAVAPDGISPAARTDLGLSVAATTGFGGAGERWRFALGPEVAVNLLRPRIVVGGDEIWVQMPITLGGSAEFTFWF